MKGFWRYCVPVGVTGLVLMLAWRYGGKVELAVRVVLSAAWPLVLGAMIAYVLNIPMRFYERRIAPNSARPLWQKCRRPVCLMLALLTLALSAYLLLALILPQLFSAFQVLLGALPPALTSLYNWLEERFAISTLLEENLPLPANQEEWRNLLEQGIALVVNGLGGVMNAAVAVTSSLLGATINLFMAMIFAINILLGKEKLGRQFTKLSHRLLGERLMGRVRNLLTLLDDCFHSYIVGQCVEAVILGTLCALGMLALRLPYALMIGALVGVSALIPIAGAYIGAAVGAVMIFSVSPTQAIIFLIFLVVLQQIEGNLIYPRTVGSTLGLPGMWVLAAVLIGGGVMGIMGMILFVPLTAAAYRLLSRYAAGEDPLGPAGPTA